MEEKSLKEIGGKKFNIKTEIIEWLIAIFAAYILYLFISYFFINLTGIRQTSMLNTADNGDKVVLQSLKVFKRELKYEDIVTIDAPQNDAKEIIKDADGTIRGENAIAEYIKLNKFQKILCDFFQINKKTYIKRVIGLPGDHIVINLDGSVERNGEILEEKYTKSGYTTRLGEFIDVEVPDNAVFVMGDNREDSMDSRYFGCIPINNVNGYVLFRIFPFDKFGKL